MTCPGPDCPMCSGEACSICATGARCDHDVVDRHRNEPAENRVPTVRDQDPIIAGRIEVDLADGEAVARFLELVAKVARTRGRLIVTIE